MKYTEKIRIRLTADELIHLQKIFEESQDHHFRSGGKNFSAFIRDRLLAGANLKNEVLEKQNQKLRYEIRKIGVNINQVSKKINAGFSQPSDMAELKSLMKEVDHMIDTYIKKVDEKWESQN